MLRRTLICREKQKARLKRHHVEGGGRQTYHGGESLLHDREEAMIDVDGQVTEDMPVFRQVKVLQAVLVLPRSVLFRELLMQRDGGET